MDAPLTRCADCGAAWRDGEDSCAARFDRLLALDHSRREPWGSRHGIAFAVYALQHLTQFPATSRSMRETPDLVVPHPRDGFAVTIDALGDFDAASYVTALERWCVATLDGLDAAAA